MAENVEFDRPAQEPEPSDTSVVANVKLYLWCLINVIISLFVPAPTNLDPLDKTGLAERRAKHAGINSIEAVLAYEAEVERLGNPNAVTNPSAVKPTQAVAAS